MIDVNVNNGELKALISFHAMIGCDYVSTFFRKGKPTYWEKMIEKNTICKWNDAVGRSC